MTPVTPSRSIRVVAAWPPSSENSACSTGVTVRPRRAAWSRNAASLRSDGVVLGAEDQPDALVAERGEVAERLGGRGQVVGGHAREVQVVDRRVDQHDGDAAAVQQPVVIVRGGELGEVAAGEHDP